MNSPYTAIVLQSAGHLRSVCGRYLPSGRVAVHAANLTFGHSLTFVLETSHKNTCFHFDVDAMQEIFDADTFISEIQKYPCIWDYKCESYSNRMERNNAWTDICEKFTINFAEKSVKEKDDIGKAFQKKWRILRDGFTREVKKNKSTKSGSAPSSKRQYVFFHQLSFLLPLAEARANTSNSLADTFPQNSEGEEDQEPPRSQPRKRKRKSVQTSEDKLIETLSQHVNTKLKEDTNDDDKYFLLSLHKDIKSISEEFKLDLKVEMLGVVKKFKTMSQRPSTQQGMNEYYQHTFGNPHHQQTSQHFSYNTNQWQNQTTTQTQTSSIPSTSRQLQTYNSNVELVSQTSVNTPFASPQDSVLSMDSAHTNSSYEYM